MICVLFEDFLRGRVGQQCSLIQLTLESYLVVEIHAVLVVFCLNPVD